MELSCHAVRKPKEAQQSYHVEKSLTLILRFLILVKKRHIIVTQQGGVKIVFKLLRNGAM